MRAAMLTCAAAAPKVDRWCEVGGRLGMTVLRY